MCQQTDRYWLVQMPLSWQHLKLKSTSIAQLFFKLYVFFFLEVDYETWLGKKSRGQALIGNVLFLFCIHTHPFLLLHMLHLWLHLLKQELKCVKLVVYWSECGVQCTNLHVESLASITGFFLFPCVICLCTHPVYSGVIKMQQAINSCSNVSFL